MAICPLLNKECITTKCSWWYQGVYVEKNKCVIALLKGYLTNILGELQWINQNTSRD